MEKLNIAELLKDCPKGMELDCTNYSGVVTFEKIADNATYPIKIEVKCGDEYFTHTLTKYGQTCKTPYNKCIIFPKGKTTWEGFQRPFKDGDVLYIDCNDNGDTNKLYQYIFILKEIIAGKIYCYCYIDEANERKKFEICCLADQLYNPRFATEKEKEKLFDAIKANGYKWNAETKTLETLKVNKFDITTLKAFESRVLVRGSNDDIWKPAIWGIYNDIYCSAYPYITTYGATSQCIPYEDNQHLLGTTNDCDDYYKTWK